MKPVFTAEDFRGEIQLAVRDDDSAAGADECARIANARLAPLIDHLDLLEKSILEGARLTHIFDDAQDVVAAYRALRKERP